ncbi:MAG: hypothetical protein R2838_13150 [Caldilineaceae bacterium]
MSLYSLIVEPNTPLYHWVIRAADVPDDDVAGEQYEIALEMLGQQATGTMKCPTGPGRPLKIVAQTGTPIARVRQPPQRGLVGTTKIIVGTAPAPTVTCIW